MDTNTTSSGGLVRADDGGLLTFRLDERQRVGRTPVPPARKAENGLCLYSRELPLGPIARSHGGREGHEGQRGLHLANLSLQHRAAGVASRRMRGKNARMRVTHRYTLALSFARPSHRPPGLRPARGASVNQHGCVAFNTGGEVKPQPPRLLVFFVLFVPGHDIPRDPHCRSRASLAPRSARLVFCFPFSC